MSWREAPLVLRAKQAAARVRAWWRRARPAPLALRVAVWLTGTAALTVAAPPIISWSVAALAAALLAMLPAGRPGGAGAGALIVACVLLLAVRAPGGGDLGLAPAGLAAGLLYLHHGTAALAAAVPTDAVLPAGVVWHWARRTGSVLVVAAVVAVTMVGLASRAPTGPVSLLLAVAMVAALAVVGALAFLRHRRGT